MKFNIILFLVIIASPYVGSLFAQPLNDQCSGAISVLTDGTCVNGTTAGAFDSWLNTIGCQTSQGNGSSSIHPDVWYTFVATGSQAQFNITTSSPFTGNIELTLVQGTCNSTFTLAGSSCGASPLSTIISGHTQTLK